MTSVAASYRVFGLVLGVSENFGRMYFRVVGVAGLSNGWRPTTWKFVGVSFSPHKNSETSKPSSSSWLRRFETTGGFTATGLTGIFALSAIFSTEDRFEVLTLTALFFAARLDRPSLEPVNADNLKIWLGVFFT